jgi:D-alanine-D-alanine ligase
MHKIRVGVLRGGANEYETSLKTGEVVVKHLPEDYYTEDIFITRDGKWHKDGLEITPHHALSHVDLVFNALHGPYVNHDHVQHMLELHKIPFTGAGVFTSAMARNSLNFKELMKRENIRAIPHRLVEIPTDGRGEDLDALFRTFAPPLIVRPMSPGAGVMLAHTHPDFLDMLEKAFIDADQIILEEYIPGTSASVGVIENYRDQDLYALPAVSSLRLTYEEKQELEDMARRVHSALAMRHYSRVDFLVSPRRGIFVTQAVPLPSLHEESVFHRALQSVGAPMSHFLDHVVQLALNKRA